ncbi:hypothetical protein HZS_6105 [Henneguya salminicola]|nr:hypothetical protein HZS_6105 [Henneguya salminicola]
MGPYDTIPIETPSQVCRSIENEHFRLSGFTIKHLDTLHLKKTELYNEAKFLMVPNKIICGTCQVGNMAAQVVSFQHGRHELGSEVYWKEQILPGHDVLNKVKMSEDIVSSCLNPT